MLSSLLSPFFHVFLYIFFVSSLHYFLSILFRFILGSLKSTLSYHYYPYHYYYHYYNYRYIIMICIIIIIIIVFIITIISIIKFYEQNHSPNEQYCRNQCHHHNQIYDYLLPLSHPTINLTVICFTVSYHCHAHSLHTHGFIVPRLVNMIIISNEA